MRKGNRGKFGAEARVTRSGIDHQKPVAGKAALINLNIQSQSIAAVSNSFVAGVIDGDVAAVERAKAAYEGLTGKSVFDQTFPVRLEGHSEDSPVGPFLLATASRSLEVCYRLWVHASAARHPSSLGFLAQASQAIEDAAAPKDAREFGERFFERLFRPCDVEDAISSLEYIDKLPLGEKARDIAKQVNLKYLANVERGDLRESIKPAQSASREVSRL